MVGGDDINHVDIKFRRLLVEFKTAVNHLSNMPVGMPAEVGIFRQDFGFNIFNNFGINLFCGMARIFFAHIIYYT